MNFAELATLYTEEKRKKLKVSSFQNLTFNLERYVLPCFADLPTDKLTKDEILFRMNSMKSLGGTLGKQTKEKNFELVKRIAKRGMEYGVVPPFLLDFPIGENEEKIPLQTVQAEEATVLSDVEIKAIIAYATAHPSYKSLGVLLSLCMGLRIGEVCGLKWTDFNFEKNAVLVARTVQRVKIDTATKVIATPSWSGLSRQISFPDAVGAVILQNFTERNGFILTGSNKPIEPRFYRRIFSSFTKECGIRDVQFGVLRNTYKQRLGKELKQAQKTVWADYFFE